MSKVKLMSVAKMDQTVGLKYVFTEFAEQNLTIQGKSKDTASKNPTLALVSEEGKRYRVGIGPLYNACIEAGCKAIFVEDEFIQYDTEIPFHLNAEEGNYAITNP